MKFRSIDSNGDWNFGNGTQAYAADLQALMLNLRTRILSWVDDCFFDTQNGLDWKNLLEYGQQKYLQNAIKSLAAKTAGVLRVYDIVVSVSASRVATVTFSVDTIYGSNVQNAINMALGAAA